MFENFIIQVHYGFVSLNDSMQIRVGVCVCVCVLQKIHFLYSAVDWHLMYCMYVLFGHRMFTLSSHPFSSSSSPFIQNVKTLPYAKP